MNTSSDVAISARRSAARSSVDTDLSNCPHRIRASGEEWPQMISFPAVTLAAGKINPADGPALRACPVDHVLVQSKAATRTTAAR